MCQLVRGELVFLQEQHGSVDTTLQEVGGIVLGRGGERGEGRGERGEGGGERGEGGRERQSTPHLHYKSSTRVAVIIHTIDFDV